MRVIRELGGGPLKKDKSKRVKKVILLQGKGMQLLPTSMLAWDGKESERKREDEIEG